MSIQDTIRKKIEQELSPLHLDIVDESHKHQKGLESHFKILIVSEKFRGQNRLDRQRLVNNILKEELSEIIHALTQKTLTPEEWKASSPPNFESPNCIHHRK